VAPGRLSSAPSSAAVGGGPGLRPLLAGGGARCAAMGTSRRPRYAGRPAAGRVVPVRGLGGDASQFRLFGAVAFVTPDRWDLGQSGLRRALRGGIGAALQPALRAPAPRRRRPLHRPRADAPFQVYVVSGRAFEPGDSAPPEDATLARGGGARARKIGAIGRRWSRRRIGAHGFLIALILILLAGLTVRLGVLTDSAGRWWSGCWIASRRPLRDGCGWRVERRRVRRLRPFAASPSVRRRKGAWLDAHDGPALEPL